jgi:hypothetical protein
MTTPIEKTSLFWTYLSPSFFGIVRAAVGTPIDVVATREILQHKNTLQVLKETAIRDYAKGFQPNTIKFITRTPVQFYATHFFSSVIPTDLHPAARGFALGFLTSGFESFFFNVFNSIRTRFIQGEKWRDIGPSVLVNGLTAAWSHRALSSAIFFSVYEPLKAKYPSQGMAVSTCAGVIQVIFTAPFYVATIERQRKDATAEPLRHTLMRLAKRAGFVRGLVLPALAPRLMHTIAITGFFMKLIDDKLGLIHRKV